MHAPRLPLPATVCALAASLLGLTAPGLAGAQDLPLCFGGEAPAGAAVTLDRTLRTSAECQYSLTAGGEFRDVAAGQFRITALLERLGWRRGQDATIYGRRRGEERPASSVFVDHCTDYLIQPGGSFSVGPGPQPGELLVRRASPACGATNLSVHFACAAERIGTRALPTGMQEAVLPACPSSYRVSLVSGDAPAYALGSLTSGSQTPLQTWFDRDDDVRHPVLRADFMAGPRGIAFVLDDPALADVWAELRTALAADAAAIVRNPVGSGRVCAEGEPVPIAVNERGITIDERFMAQELARELGDTGGLVAPRLEDWQRLARSMTLCLKESYGARDAEGLATHSFEELVNVQALTPAEGAEICVQHRRVRLTPEGPRPVDGDRQCVPAGAGGVLAAVAGATLQVPEGTMVCSGSAEVPLPEGSRELTLGRGFFDVRMRTQAGCETNQTASLGRVGTLDPGRDWIPVGVERREDSGVAHEDMPAFAGIRPDSPERFSLVRRTDELRFGIVTPEGLAAAWNDAASGRGTVISRFAPVVRAEEAALGAAGPPTFSTRVTETSGCPVAPDAGEVVDASTRDIPVDITVYAHLILDDGDGQRCLAHAAFKSWESRVVANTAKSERRQLRVGFLGDALLGVFISPGAEMGGGSSGTPVDAGTLGALGVAFPLAYMDLHLGLGFDFQISAPFTAAIDWQYGGGSRVGVALMGSIKWGVANIAPDLLSVGMLLHAPWPHAADQVYSLFFGVNVSSLIDLAGGR